MSCDICWIIIRLCKLDKRINYELIFSVLFTRVTLGAFAENSLLTGKTKTDVLFLILNTMNGPQTIWHLRQFATKDNLPQPMLSGQLWCQIVHLIGDTHRLSM